MDARTVSSPDELERRADRIRGQIGATVDLLREKLSPRNLAEEVAERSGVRDITPASVFDFAAKRHPVPTALIGLGLGLWAFSTMRSSGSGGSNSFRDTVGALSESARKAFRQRADAKREEFIHAAEAHLSAGAEHLGEAVEKGIGELVSRTPVGSAARPLLESAVQLILIGAIEAMIAKRRK